MTTSAQVPPQFEAVRDVDEQIFWVGGPAFVPFVLTGLPFFVLGLLWGAMDFGLVHGVMHDPKGHTTVRYVVPFMLIHLTPFWIGTLNIVRLVLVHRNTCYAVSNKRLMLRTGFWGIDFKALDYDRISNLEVDVGPVENMWGVGTIVAHTGGDNSKTVREQFVAIEHPYEVFKRIKEVSVNVKTDWNYPNALRPEENAGYRTRYTGTR